MKYFYLYIFLVVSIVQGCNSKTSASRKPVTNIQITPTNKLVTYGNTFSINLISKITPSKITELSVYLNNTLLETQQKSDFSLTVDSILLPGKYSIKTIAKNEKGKTGVNYSMITVLSDINPESKSFKVLQKLNHNTKNFTQGLEFYNNQLIESTGNYNESFIYVYNKDLSGVEKENKLSSQFFGEGITVLNDKIYQLTYKSQKGFVYNANTLELIDEFVFNSQEGWGLTNDGKYLIMSDGTSKISYIDPETYKTVKSVNVATNTSILQKINELEYVNGYIYANIWMSDKIIKFEAKTGRVVSTYNLYGLLTNLARSKVDVLNGIAYHKQEDVFYITGKWWPSIFKVELE